MNRKLLIDYDEVRKLFDKEFKETMQLIQAGETHLDNLAEGFTEADRVLFRLLFLSPQTNADRIRTMSDEELAEFLAAKCADIQAQNAFTKESPPTATQLSALAHTWYCQWMYWLRQPVKDGEDE